MNWRHLGLGALVFAFASFLGWRVIVALRKGEVGFSYPDSFLFPPVRRDRMPFLFWSAIVAHTFIALMGFGAAVGFSLGLGLP